MKISEILGVNSMRKEFQESTIYWSQNVKFLKVFDNSLISVNSIILATLVFIYITEIERDL